MPKVGSKHFSYTAAGYAAAKKEAKKTGKKVVAGKRTSAQTRKNNMDK
jgi:hypothetical protein